MWMRIIVGVAVVIAAVAAADGVFPDKKRQESFWQIYTSALRADKVAEYQVGVMYERGIGVEQNQTQAAVWYEKAAWQGYMDAQYNLALMYASGRGVDKNLDRAMIWLAKAAKQGDKEARKLLLEIIDGKHDDHAQTTAAQKKPAASGGETEAITPVTLVAREGADVCTSQGECTPCKAKTVFTSKSRQGARYKISGIVTKQGWESYEGDGWIAEESVDTRR